MAVIPNNNVNLATNIRDVLNSAGGSVSNDVTTFFKAGAKINWCSKHKPVTLKKNFCQDFDSSRSDYDATWWLGTSQMCGLQFSPMLTSITQLPDAYGGDMNNWRYLPPDGGQDAPMRLSDFCGYDTLAEPPIYNLAVFEMMNTSSADKLAMRCYVVGSGTSGISFLDMPMLKNYYLGLYLVHKTNGTSLWNSQSTKLSEGVNNVNINPYGAREGEYWAYPFLSEEPQLQNKLILTTNIYTLPGVSPLTTKIMSSASAYTVSLNVKSATALSILLAYSIKNNTTSAKTFRTNRLMIRPRGVDFDDHITNDDYSEALGDITVQEGKTYTKNVTIPLSEYPELQQTGVVYLSLDAADILISENYTAGAISPLD